MAAIKPLIRAAGRTRQMSDGDFILTWDYLVTHWSTAPALVGTIAAGDVYSHTHGGVTRYRLVPTVYSAALDAFYSAFDGLNLSGFLVARG